MAGGLYEALIKWLPGSMKHSSVWSLQMAGGEMLVEPVCSP